MSTGREKLSLTKYGLGLVIGKFLPPHCGHSCLIEKACAECERVQVIVCDQVSDPIPAKLRAAWIRELHPRANVTVFEDRYDPCDSALWAKLTLHWLGAAPDAVFTSEDYGDRYAALMGAVHVCVDRARRQVPCSGTAIREDPYAMWQFIAPPVRAWYAKRVCVLGAESTGTTTLAKALADKLGTVSVPEYGREYGAAKPVREEWRTGEFVHIAEEQNRRENEAAREANRVLVCDTDSLATTVWHRRYVGGSNPVVERLARERRCDLYLLTGDEIPFVQDGVRDGEHIRHEMHRWFAELLAGQPVPWLLLRGSLGERLQIAMNAVHDLFAGSRWKPG
jgi:HTH-type transcriptional repressor of NAD biosynthesis genes